MFIPGISSPIWACEITMNHSERAIFKKTVDTSLKQLFIKTHKPEFLEPQHIICKVQISRMRVLNVKQHPLYTAAECAATLRRYSISAEPHNIWQLFPFGDNKRLFFPLNI